MPIFGDYSITITDKILESQSIASIVNEKLFIHIDYIPESLQLQNKLKELLETILLKSAVQEDNLYVNVQCQVLISLDEPHPFLEDFLSSSKIFFLNSIDEINSKLEIEDRIALLNSIDNDLENFSDELAVPIKGIYNLTDQEIQQLRGNIISQITHNDKLRFDDKKYKTDNELYIRLLQEQGLIGSVESNSSYETLDPLVDDYENIIPNKERLRHTLILGMTGYGKTELIKTLIFRDIIQNCSSLILLDIHGDLADEIARLVKDKERLVFIEPQLQSTKTPTINIFSLINRLDIDSLAQMITSVVKDMQGDDKFSGNMQDLVAYCIKVLLHKGDSDFSELRRFMNPKRNSDLVDLGKNSEDELIEEYFTDDFESSEQTMSAVKRRLNKLVSDPLFRNLMNAQSTIDLEKEMNTKGKIIVFKIPQEKMEETAIYYIRFIIGLIQMFAFKRASTPIEERVHTHLYIDEFQNFTVDKIEKVLTESRKYGLSLTMAHQTISQITKSKLKDIILSNTNVKIIGRNSNKTLQSMNETLNTKLNDLENLGVGEFYIKSGTNELKRIINTNILLDGKMNISDQQWQEHKEYQLKYYYKDIPRKVTQSEIDSLIDTFIRSIKSKDIDYFCKIKSHSKEMYDELIYNFEDDIGYISQPKLRDYFNIINGSLYKDDNKSFITILKDKDELFKQNVKDNTRYNNSSRYKLVRTELF